MTHKKIRIRTTEGEIVDAAAPMIISCSRATDIPAFYSKEFFHSLDLGYTVWKNPYNGRSSYISFANTRFIVFWSKNPSPLLPLLPKLKERGISFYIQYTLNDYEKECYEPNVPGLNQRIDTFKRIVDTYGIDHAIWRFDPLLLTDKINCVELLERIRRIGTQLKGYTTRLVFSFADIAGYKKVGANLRRAGVNYIEWTDVLMLDFAKRLYALNKSELHLRLSTCAEPIDLTPYGIEHSRCIDPDLIAQLAPDDITLQMWLFGATKDKGQRKDCGCILSKDIGRYDTCPHGCLYCYANTTPHVVI